VERPAAAPARALRRAAPGPHPAEAHKTSQRQIEMILAHEKLPGLDRDRIVALVEPILVAHGVEGVELVWKTDRGERVLELTVERPEARIPGAGITVDLCSEISRDLSAALDVADVIPGRYRLEVGSPGVERALYSARDFDRFAGQLAKLKLRQPMPDGQKVVRGTLQGLGTGPDGTERVQLSTERGEIELGLEEIETARLVFDWTAGEKPGRRKAAPGRRTNR
jgi:ribosome maturation factor RimP